MDDLDTPTNTSMDADQAALQLGLLQKAQLPRSNDRRLYALGTAAMGVMAGITFVAFQHSSSGFTTGLWLVGFIAIAGFQWWVQTTARTVPRHFSRYTGIGFLASMAVALFIALPILNLRDQDGVNSFPVLALAAAGIALPCWVAAVALGKRG